MYRDVIYADYLPIHKLYSLLWQSSSIRGDHLWHSPFLFTISNALSQFENNLKAIKSLELTITYSFLYGQKKLKTHIQTTIKNMHFKKSYLWHFIIYYNYSIYEQYIYHFKENRTHPALLSVVRRRPPQFDMNERRELSISSPK